MAQAGFEIGYNANTKIPSISNEPKELKLNVDGKETSIGAVNIKGSNYVAVRDIVALLGKNVSYDNATKLTTIKD